MEIGWGWEEGSGWRRGLSKRVDTQTVGKEYKKAYPKSRDRGGKKKGETTYERIDKSTAPGLSPLGQVLCASTARWSLAAYKPAGRY